MSLSEKIFSLFKRDAILFFSTQLTCVVIARELGSEMMGLWVILLLIPNYAEAFGRLKFELSAVYYIGKKKENVGEVAFILLVIAMVSSTIMLVMIFVWLDWIYEQLFKNINMDVTSLLYVVLPLIPLRLIYINYSYLFISIEDFRSYNGMVIFQAIFTSLMSIAFILLLKLGVLGALLGNIIGLSAGIVFGVMKLHAQEKLKPNFNLQLLSKMMKYSIHHYLSGLIGYCQNNQISLIASIYIIPSQVAFYTLAKSISEFANRMIPTAMSTVMLPQVSKSDNVHASMMVAKAFRITLFVISVLSGLLVLGIKPLIYLLYGKDFYPLIVPFLIILPSIILMQAALVFSSYFSGIGRADLLTKNLVFPFLIQLFTAYIFIPKYGLLGVSCCYSFSVMMYFLLQVFCFIKHSDQKLNSLIIKSQEIADLFLFAKGKFLYLIPIKLIKTRN